MSLDSLPIHSVAGSPQRVSLRDIAKVVGVSHATVSMALRNQTRVSKATTEHIKRTAAEMGYFPDPMLTALASYRRGKPGSQTQTAIGWLAGGNDTSAESDAYWRGAFAQASKAGYRMEKFEVKGRGSQGLGSRFNRHAVRGLLLAPSARKEDFPSVAWERFSIIRLGWGEDTPGCHRVAVDPVHAGRLAAVKLAEAGFRRVGLVTRSGGLDPVPGFLAARPAGAIALFRVDERNARDTRAEFDGWMKAHRPDAILTNFDGACGLLTDAGLDVPEGLKVFSFQAGCGVDPLHEETGRTAFLILNSMIQAGEVGFSQVRRCTLIEGVWAPAAHLPRNFTTASVPDWTCSLP